MPKIGYFTFKWKEPQGIMLPKPKNYNKIPTNYRPVRLLDQYKWRNDVDIGVKCHNFRLFKTEFMFEKYLIDFSDALQYIVCKFRTVSHKLPIVDYKKWKGM